MHTTHISDSAGGVSLQIPPGTEIHLDRDPPGQRPLGQTPAWTETSPRQKFLGQRPPGQTPWTETPSPERTWDLAARQEVTSYSDHLVERMTDTRL